jgi:hypothetical protein
VACVALSATKAIRNIQASAARVGARKPSGLASLKLCATIGKVHDMEDQEKQVLQTLFDKVALHLVTQGTQARNSEGTCLYRDVKSGRKCAIGALIPDENYDPSLEGESADSYIIWSRIPEVQAFGVHNLSTELPQKLWLLQDIHDGYSSSNWNDQLRAFAKDNCLTVPDCVK